MRICVFGAASNKIDKVYIDTVEKLGEEMAKRGHTLVFGAGANGLMGAVARGVHRAGGKIIGIIPAFFRDEAIEAIFEDCDELIYTESMAERKLKMRELADAFITVPGGVGTLEEFFEVFTLKQLARHTKPIAILDEKNYYRTMENFFSIAVQEGFIQEECAALYTYSDSIDEVLEYVEKDERAEKDVHDLKKG